MAPDRHVKRIGDERGPQMSRDCMDDDEASGRIHHNGALATPFTGLGTGNVRERQRARSDEAVLEGHEIFCEHLRGRLRTPLALAPREPLKASSDPLAGETPSRDRPPKPKPHTAMTGGKT